MKSSKKRPADKERPGDVSQMKKRPASAVALQKVTAEAKATKKAATKSLQRAEDARGTAESADTMAFSAIRGKRCIEDRMQKIEQRTRDNYQAMQAMQAMHAMLPSSRRVELIAKYGEECIEKAREREERMETRMQIFEKEIEALRNSSIRHLQWHLQFASTTKASTVEAPRGETNRASTAEASTAEASTMEASGGEASRPLKPAGPTIAESQFEVERAAGSVEGEEEKRSVWPSVWPNSRRLIEKGRAILVAYESQKAFMDEAHQQFLSNSARWRQMAVDP